jgi:hypothetical protein
MLLFIKFPTTQQISEVSAIAKEKETNLFSHLGAPSVSDAAHVLVGPYHSSNQ